MISRAMGLLMLACALGCSAAIHHGLDESSANEALTALERAGIAASKRLDDSGTFTLAVAQGDAVGAMELLRALGLPRDRRLGLAELYKSGSLVPSPTEERARYSEGLGAGIERTLESFDGVALARVHLVLPEADPLAADGAARVPAQAAVLVKLKPGRPAVAEAEVQKLVAGSVPGLAPAAVSVVLTPAALPPARPAALVAVGPWRMAAASRASFVTSAVVVLVLVVVLAIFVLVLARRLSAMQRKA